MLLPSANHACWSLVFYATSRCGGPSCVWRRMEPPSAVKGGNAAVRILAAFPTIRQASGALDLFLSDMSPRAYWWCKINRVYHVLWCFMFNSYLVPTRDHSLQLANVANQDMNHLQFRHKKTYKSHTIPIWMCFSWISLNLYFSGFVKSCKIKMNDPKVTMGFNAKLCQTVLIWMICVYHHFWKPPNHLGSSYYDFFYDWT